VVKKRTARKQVRKKKAAKRTAASRGGDQSRLDLKPLHRHIRKRIKELESKRGAAPEAAIAAMGEPDDTIERLKNVLETLEDICHPTMAIPI
jgi:hypothetical protein